MPVTGWNIVNEGGRKWLVIDVARLKVPLEFDPNSGVFFMCSMPGDAIFNYPGLVAGDDGKPADIDSEIDFKPLAYNDPMPDFARWVKTAPGLFQLKLGLHVGGAPGADGADLIRPEDYGIPHVGWYPAVKQVAADQYAFDLTPPPVSGRFGPASVANTPSGQPGFTVCTIGIDAQARDCFPRLEAQSVISGTGMDVRADLLGRLSYEGIVNGETQGTVIARGFGPVGTNPLGIATTVVSARPKASGAAVGRIPAGKPATVYVRVERQAGNDSFVTSADTTIAEVVLEPLP